MKLRIVHKFLPIQSYQWTELCQVAQIINAWRRWVLCDDHDEDDDDDDNNDGDDNDLVEDGVAIVAGKYADAECYKDGYECGNNDDDDDDNDDDCWWW